MSYSVLYSSNFKKEAKKLAKKYASLRNDLDALIEELQESPDSGTLVGKNCYKIRMAITSKGKGKSGGARVITFVKITETEVYLLSIFDKSDKDNISDKELAELIKNYDI